MTVQLRTFPYIISILREDLQNNRVPAYPWSPTYPTRSMATVESSTCTLSPCDQQYTNVSNTGLYTQYSS